MDYPLAGHSRKPFQVGSVDYQRGTAEAKVKSEDSQSASERRGNILKGFEELRRFMIMIRLLVIQAIPLKQVWWLEVANTTAIPCKAAAD